MDDVENLLIPQITMDVDETPIELNLRESGNTGELVAEERDPDAEEQDNLRILNLLEIEEISPAQTPKPLTEIELEAKERLFSAGHPAIEFVRMHCSSCSIHLGTAPINQENRYIHPLLNVLLCKSCYDFYCSGDFEKDEDGSELYCRWCGQGGKVMCCSGCAYVFCQRCIRRNLGKRTLDLIIDSDDWHCFGCNPSQLINLRILCATLFEYIQNEIRDVKESRDYNRLKRDLSTCCNNRYVTVKPVSTMNTSRRKKRTDLDKSYDPSVDEEELEEELRPVLLQKALMTPPANNPMYNKTAMPRMQLISKMSTGQFVPTDSRMVKITPPPLMPYNNNVARTSVENRPVRAPQFPAIAPRLPVILPKPIIHGSQNYITPPSSNGAAPVRQQGVRTATPTLSANSVRILAPQNQKVTPVSSVGQVEQNTWFNVASSITSNIVQKLSRNLSQLNNEHRNARTIEQMATVHNRLQELLSSSVNSLIQVRKNLRNEFLSDLNKMRFSTVKKPQSVSLVTKKRPPLAVKPNPTALEPNSIHTIEDDDDDVVIVNGEDDPLSVVPQPAPIPVREAPVVPTGFLKVKSFSALNNVSKECISLPSLRSSSSHPIKNNSGLEKNIHDVGQDGIEVEDCDSPVPKVSDCQDELSLEMKRALAVSTFERLILENSKYKVDTSEICPEDLPKMLTARVILATDFSSHNFVGKRAFSQCKTDSEDEDNDGYSSRQLPKKIKTMENHCDEINNDDHVTGVGIDENEIAHETSDTSLKVKPMESNRIDNCTETISEKELEVPTGEAKPYTKDGNLAKDSNDSIAEGERNNTQASPSNSQEIKDMSKEHISAPEISVNASDQNLSTTNTEDCSQDVTPENNISETSENVINEL